ncbi:MAG: sigma-54-dependent Fis family transcriptional regulator [Planctomycetaceae bacterium]|nr:sigma-54-dependent Fis family transcriptional regulator [Planctomycetaceae bacterium]
MIRRIPGPEWEIVLEHGQHAVADRMASLWDRSLDRDAPSIATTDSGWTIAAFPLAGNVTCAGMMVTAARHADEDLLSTGTASSKALSLALRLVERQSVWRRQVDRLRSTLDIASRLSTEDDTAPLLDLIATEATRMLDCDRSSIFLLDAERDEVEARPALGVKGASLRLPAHEGLVGETIRTGRSINVEDAYDDSRFNQEVDRRSGYRTKTLICVPLSDGRGRTIGAFQAINRNDGRPFSDEDVECLRQLGVQAAVALRHVQERDVLNRSRSQLTEQVTSGVSIVGDSAAITALRDTIRRLASTDLPVLVLGESGTGKEVVAQSLHYGGERADCPFVAVNCAAISESLLESELFGHEQGAFTDARETRQGKFELANGGTLFLDEIGDMSIGGQAKLLRVLEQKVITRVGGSQTIPINVRIVAATNANLSGAVREKKFREDLYYRLSVVTLDLPPLRERPEDVLPLAEFFLKKFTVQARRPHLQLSQDARRRLQSHLWPGNIRELRNLMERIAFLNPTDRVEADDLAFILSPEANGPKALSLDLGLDQATRDFQRDYIRRAIKACDGNMTDAAKMLGLHRSNMYRKMKQLGMSEVSGEE